MIDWVKAVIPWRHQEPINEGQIIRTNGDGSIQWTVNARKPIRGSYDAKINIHSDPNTWDPATQQFTAIVFDGNPLKFFQGHNAWGTNDLVGLMAETCHRVSSIIDRPINDWDWYQITHGIYQLLRVDCTDMFEAGNQANVKAILYALERQARMRHRGPTINSDGTLYWGKKSRRWALKMYNKLEEILSKSKGHALPEELASIVELKNWISSKIRAELVLRSMELKDRGLHLAANWNENTPLEVLIQAIEGLEMSENITLPQETINGLPPRLVGVYHLWKEGHDIRAMYPSTTFKRYRKQLQEAAGIDIAIKQAHTSENRPSNVVEFKRVLTVELASAVPSWAVGTPLYFEPRAKIAR